MHDVLTLLHRRRKWPGSRDHVRIGEVFEQEVPCLCVRVPDRFEATRDKARRHYGGNLGVERGFKDNGVRRVRGRAIVRQAQPDDVREQR